MGHEGGTQCHYWGNPISTSVRYDTKVTSYPLLKEIWTKEIDLSPGMELKPIQYLENLKDKLNQTGEFANKYAQSKQKKYADQYNKRAKEMSFQCGEMVIVLYPTSTNKSISRWHGPCEVLERQSKHSYLIDLIDLGEQGRKIVHANKFKKVSF